MTSIFALISQRQANDVVLVELLGARRVSNGVSKEYK